MTKSKKDDLLLHQTMFGFFVSGMCVMVIGNFVPFLREAYGLDYKFAGILISAASIGGLISIFLSGILPFYLGRKLSILLWSVWMVFGYFIVAMGFDLKVVLLIAFFGMGLSRGGNANFTSTMVSTLPSERVPMGHILIHMFFAIGALLSPLLLVLLVSNGFSFKAMAGFLCALAAFRLFVYGKMDIPPLEVKEKGVKSMDLSFFKDMYFWIGAMILLFYASVEYGIVGWLVTYFQDTGILNPNMAQLTNSLFWAIVLTGRFVGSKISTKITQTGLLVIDAIGMTAFFFLMFFSKSALPVLIGLCGVGFFMATMYPTTYTLGSRNFGDNDFACSMLNLLPCAGGIVAPVLVGVVAENGGIAQGMGLLVILTVALLITIVTSSIIIYKTSI